MRTKEVDARSYAKRFDEEGCDHHDHLLCLTEEELVTDFSLKKDHRRPR
jgi:hypothetical protein